MRKFKTESQKMLDLVINSIYTNPEIFLRELISNASDAIDKLYFRSLTDSSIELDKDDLEIFVSYDRASRTIMVSDNGIGMTRDQLDKNLGTIAHSDSMAFKTENDGVQGGDIDIIGQFGVGFYSSFLVADEVHVVSRSYDAENGEAFEWVSNGRDGYDIRPAERSQHGTDVILHVKESTIGPDGMTEVNYDHFLTEGGLYDLIKRYSNYVRYPIRMSVQRSVLKPRPEGIAEDDPNYKPQYETRTIVETINSMIPIWKRRRSDVTDEEYAQFYKSQFHDWQDPLRTISVHAEGQLTYDALLFIPAHAQADLFTREFEKGLALYSSNVLIMEKCPDLLPDCFNFVVGVVDSPDLHLNISRETLQQNSQMRAIMRRLEKKVKSELLAMLAGDRAGYEQFFANFGRCLKFGVYSADFGEDAASLAELLMYESAKQNRLVTLKEYVGAIDGGTDEDAAGKDGEGAGADADAASDAAALETEAFDPNDPAQAIYFAVADTIELGRKMPIVGSVLGHGYDVLLCRDQIDEFCFGILHEFQGHPIKNVVSDNLNLESADEREAAEALQEQNAGLFEAMKDILGEKVVKVSCSTRLGDVAAMITTEGPITIEMERVFAYQAAAAAASGEPIDASQLPKARRVLELNAQSPVFRVLADAQTSGDTEKLEQYTKLLYDQALLFEGLPVDDPYEFASAITALMV